MVAEHLKGDIQRASERLTYGQANDENATHNRCGRLMRHDDGAGSLEHIEYGLLGLPCVAGREFLQSLELPDWPQDPPARNRLLQPQAYVTRTAFDATGKPLSQWDAAGHCQRFAYDVAGQPLAASLQLNTQPAPIELVRGIRYNASGQVLRQTAGNGCISTWRYDEADHRLLAKRSALPGLPPLQDFRYRYDPVGNILAIEYPNLPTHHYRNQRIEPVRQFRYDSLYQLVEAGGYEMEGNPDRPGLPPRQPVPLDPNRLSLYTQRYEYDAAGNLLARHHTGNATWRMRVSAASNRSVPQGQDIADGFDANGNLLQLQPGQAMAWDARNRLLQVIRVARAGGDDDLECYRYDAAGQRLRKASRSMTSGRPLCKNVLYLPGLELRQDSASDERYQVISVATGLHAVRVLHWQAGKPSDIEADQISYALADHLGSSTLELDAGGNVLSHEGYYPFGGTAWWAARSRFKTVRYSGKEMDATGLYDYGHRYYAPWMQRWVSADPLGFVDGMNLFLLAGNNPVTFADLKGLTRYRSKYDMTEIGVRISRGKIVARGLTAIREKRPQEGQKLADALELANYALDESLKTLSNIEQLRPEYQRFTDRILGSPGTPVSTLKDRVNTLGGFLSNFNPEQFALVKSKIDTEIAFTVKEDPHDRIFISENGIREPKETLAMTIIHEASHIKLKTVDLFYYPRGYRVNPMQPHEPMDQTETSMKQKINEQISQNLTSKLSSSELKNIFGTTQPTEIAKQLSDPDHRREVFLWNADVWPVLIFGYAHSALWQRLLAS